MLGVMELIRRLWVCGVWGKGERGRADLTTRMTGTGVPAKGDEGAEAEVGARRVKRPLEMRKRPWAAVI